MAGSQHAVLLVCSYSRLSSGGVMESIPYHASLRERMRVLLVHDKHSHNQKTAIVMHVLPNPSQASRHQWYDVRFDDGIWGRFQERNLQSIPPVEAESPIQASVA